MSVMIEAVCFISRYNFCIQTVYSHIHHTELGVVVHLFLSEESHSCIGACAVTLNEICGRYKHTTASAGRIQYSSMTWFKDIDNHSHEGFWCEEHTIIRCNSRCKFIEEVFIDTTDDVVFHFIECAVIENTQKFTQQVILENSIILWQNTTKLCGLSLNQLHCFINCFSDICFIREVYEVVITCFFGEKDSTFTFEIVSFNRQNTSASCRTVFENVSFYKFKATICITQKNQSQYRHTVFLRCYFRVNTQKVCGFPEFGFQFSYIYHRVTPFHLVFHQQIQFFILYYSINFYKLQQFQMDKLNTIQLLWSYDSCILTDNYIVDDLSDTFFKW